MSAPTVHLNGTSREELMQQRSDAIRALSAAERALRAMTPHPRDYPSGVGLTDLDRFGAAVNQHERRLDALHRLRQSIEAERQAIFATRKGA